MAVKPIVGGRDPGRNDPCPCKSGLKYKWCHGDEQKVQLVSHVANEAMQMLIIEEQLKREKIDDATYGKLKKHLIDNATQIELPRGTAMATCKDCDAVIPETEIYCEKCRKVNE